MYEKRGGESKEIVHLVDIVNKRGHKGKVSNISGSLKKLSEYEN